MSTLKLMRLGVALATISLADGVTAVVDSDNPPPDVQHDPGPGGIPVRWPNSDGGAQGAITQWQMDHPDFPFTITLNGRAIGYPGVGPSVDFSSKIESGYVVMAGTGLISAATPEPQPGAEPQPGGTPIPTGGGDAELHGQKQYPFPGDFTKTFRNIQPPRVAGDSHTGWFKFFDSKHGDNIPGKITIEYGGAAPLITSPGDSVFYSCGGDLPGARFNVQPGASITVTGTEIDGPITMDARTPDF